MQTHAVGWFEIATSDIGRAQKFYETTMDLKLQPQEMDGFKMAWFPSHGEAYGSCGALVNGDGYKPSTEGTVVYFMTENIAKFMEKVEANGGKKLSETMDIGEHGFCAFFMDTEGNKLGIHSRNG